MSDSAPKRNGFTLVELLMTMAILGLAATAVVIAAPDPRPSLGQEADTFAARLIKAREESLLTNRPVAMEATAEGYGVSTFDGRDWSPLTEGPFQPGRWDETTRVDASDEGIRIVFDPTGVAEPATVTLARDRSRITIAVDAAGEVRIDG
ncbi:GspH/FimT family pseudopilin [Brevundimonas sp.]|uniref:GspH/FimT family pseudopilin n=1 Tax=Brevundimonas sp. TaxID=1871086 RepID=UPI002AB9698C|nr:GspH/FimT family pseudopilin [Brevundimonas sp.]MDZ4364982.1 GspH/FimT family pseudopilin [Brevundimonas sp.]